MLANNPSTIFVYPNVIYLVTKNLESGDSKIHYRRKTYDVYLLCDTSFCLRTELFHGDLSIIIKKAKVKIHKYVRFECELERTLCNAEN